MAHPQYLENLPQEVETLRSYLELAEVIVRKVTEMPPLRFNNKQCEYLALKLEEVVDGARLSCARLSLESFEVGRGAEIFQLLLKVAREIETFIGGCCDQAWVHSAILNVSKDVSSVAFNLELLNMVFNKERVGSLTVHQVEDIYDVAVQVVRDQAAMDMDHLFREARVALETSHGEEQELAGLLLKRLESIKLRSYSSGSGSMDGLTKMFEWVELGERLGSGSTGDVKEGTWLGTEVALKTFYGESVSTEEVGNIARLSHPNITSIFCSEAVRNRCTIVMELMDQTLQDEIQERSQFHSLSYTIFEAVDLMLQIGEGVNYLHSHGVVHLDLKASNILIKRAKPRYPKIGYEAVKVTDFGLSQTRIKSTSQKSPQSYNTATQRWRPPEFMDLSGTEKPPYTRKIDVYSFAMVCYFILSGDLPFNDVNSQSALMLMVRDGERPILPEHCPPALKTLIESCWVNDYSARPNFAHICKELRYLKGLLLMDLSVNQDGKLKTLLAEEISPINANQFQTSTRYSVTSPVAHTNLKQVGKGISATVYEVEWEGRKVAKKVFDGLDVPHFEREVQVLTGLENPNIISLLHSGKEKANCYILMDLMDADLLQYMREITSNKTGDDPLPFTVPEAMDLMLQVADGIRYLHEHKIVHRDLKAGNILVKRVPGTGLVARVCDFGLAIVKDNTVTYSELEPNTGTNRWIAPELIKSHSYKKKSLLAKVFARTVSSLLPPKHTKKLPFKSDVYSFAMVCYEILTGTVPFPTVGTATEVKRRVQNRERPELPPHCPPQLKALIERCWRHDPKERPKFGEICEELERLKVANLRS